MKKSAQKILLTPLLEYLLFYALYFRYFCTCYLFSFNAEPIWFITVCSIASNWRPQRHKSLQICVKMKFIFVISDIPFRKYCCFVFKSYLYFTKTLLTLLNILRWLPYFWISFILLSNLVILQFFSWGKFWHNLYVYMVEIAFHYNFL